MSSLHSQSMSLLIAESIASRSRKHSSRMETGCLFHSLFGIADHEAASHYLQDGFPTSFYEEAADEIAVRKLVLVANDLYLSPDSTGFYEFIQCIKSSISSNKRLGTAIRTFKIKVENSSINATDVATHTQMILDLFD